MHPYIAEFIGITILILLGNGTVANVLLPDTKGNNSGWMVITTGWALAVFIGVTIAGPFSGAHLNPAVTIGLAIANKFTWINVVPYVIAQFLGAAFGSFLVWILYFDHYTKTENSGHILATFCTSPAIRKPISNFISEIIGSFVLVFTIFYFTDAEITASKTSIGLGSVGAIPVAFLVWVIGIGLGGTTGYAINPARDLGPRLMHFILPIKNKGKSDWSYSLIPVIGPIIGAGIAAILFLTLR